MIEFAKFEFSLNRKVGKGENALTVREHQEAAEIPKSEWGYPPVPSNLGYLWDSFLQLHATRTIGMQANAINHSEMLAYSKLYNITLSQFDINAIKILDRIALTDPAKIKKGKNGN